MDAVEPDLVCSANDFGGDGVGHARAEGNFQNNGIRRGRSVRRGQFIPYNGLGDRVA